jgi:DNA-directed RNA polymerase beta subunit
MTKNLKNKAAITKAAEKVVKKAAAKSAEPAVRPPHYFLGEDLLTPNVNKCDGSRINMFVSHTAQFLTLNNAERPKVFTRFENQVAKYSEGMGYTKTKEAATFLGVVEFNENDKYFFFLYEDESVGVFHHTSTTRLTENYGYKNVLKIDDSLEMGDTVEAGTLLARNNMYDDSLNMQYGVNLRAIFLPKDGLTFEDGIILSESGAKKFNHTSVTEAVITLNNNDVLVNYYGTKERYQPFPQIGEMIKGRILAARRRINYNTILNDFKENSNSIESTDTCFFFNGVVENIEIFSNFADKDLEYSYNEPIRTLLTHQRAKYKEIEEMIDQFKASGWTLRDDTGYLYRKAKDYNSGVKFSQDRSEFEGAIIRFTIREDHPIYKGSKITGRYGNKGVISAIIPDHLMPQTEDGETPDVALNPLGVVGRMNPGQNYEQELNFIAEQFIKMCGDDDAMLFQCILDFYEMIGSEQLELVRNGVKSKQQIAAYLKEVRRDGLDIHQPPYFGNANPQIMTDLYNHFGVEKIKFEGISEPLVFGSMYFMQLKHEAASKFSVRSAGQVSLLNVPFKSNEQYKKGTATSNTSPIRFGEQETFNMLLLSNGPEGSKPIANFLRHYSSHNTERKNQITKLLRNDIQNIQRVNLGDETEGSITNAAQVIRSFFGGIGIQMESDQEHLVSAEEPDDDSDE